jgi:photosystem II stability/assembly factor-like uncharacterized protein
MANNGIRIALGAIAALAFCLTLLSSENGSGLAVPVAVVQVDSHHPATLLAGTVTGQLFRSRDDGVTWSLIPFPAALRCTLHSILIDPESPNVYLVGVSSEITRNAGVFRTMDGGATWDQLPGLSGRQVWALAFWASDSQVLAAGTAEGVFRTNDGGDHWTYLASHDSVWPRPVVSIVFDPKDRDTLYAGTPHLAWKTLNAGITWRRLSRGMPEDSDIFSIDVDDAHRSRLFAGACSGIYSSLDGGNSWLSLERALGEPLRTYVVVRARSLPGVVFAGTSAGLMRSPDGGATWEKVATIPARSIALDPSDSRRIFVGTDRGILLSEDAGLHFHRQSAERE